MNYLKALNKAECESLYLCIRKVCYEQLNFVTELHYRNYISGILHLEAHIVLNYGELQSILLEIENMYPELKA